MLITEDKLFDVCLNKEKRDAMLRALDIYLDRLERVQASRAVIRETIWLKKEIEKMKIC